MMTKRIPTSSLRMMVLWQLAAAIVLLGLLGSVAQAGGLFVGFEQSEGFPAVGTSFEGTTINGITWSSMNVSSLTTDSGSSGLGFPNDPGPLTGTQTAFALSDVKGKAMLVMDLDNSANLALSGVNYAFNNKDQVNQILDLNVPSINFFPSRFQIDYYDTNDQFIGTNAFGYGPDPRDEETLNRLGWSPGIADYNPVFQQFSPTGPFEGVALGKVVFKSFHDIQNNGDLIPRGRDFPDGPNPGTFHLEDITLSEATTTFSQQFPANTYRVSFETSNGVLDADGITFPFNDPGFQVGGLPSRRASQPSPASTVSRAPMPMVAIRMATSKLTTAQPTYAPAVSVRQALQALSCPPRNRIPSTASR